jgi:peptide/nickel transport system permease protein
LALAAFLVAGLIAVPLGIVAALREGTAVDNVSVLFSLVGVSIPNFWLGPLLIILFSITLGWFPVSGRDGVVSLVLPAITLGTALAAILSRMTRASLLERLGEDYLVVARAKGLPEWKVILKHALRNALIPIITVMGLQIGALLSGAIITENVFSWPGIGSLLINAIEARDYPLVQGCVLFIALSYVSVNLLTDLFYGWMDPRIRLSG